MVDPAAPRRLPPPPGSVALPPPPLRPGRPGSPPGRSAARLGNPAVWIPVAVALVALALVGGTLALTGGGSSPAAARTSPLPVPGLGPGPTIAPPGPRCVDGPWQRFATDIAGWQSYIHNDDFMNGSTRTAADLASLATVIDALRVNVTDHRLKAMLRRAADAYQHAADLVALGRTGAGARSFAAGNAEFLRATQRAAVLPRC